MKEHSDAVSWEHERHSAPPRPDMSSGLPEEQPRSRPALVTTSATLALLALLAYLAVTVIASLRFDEVHAELLEIVPTELSDEYSPEDIDTAVSVLLITAGVVGTLVMLAQALAAFRCRARASASARFWFVLLAFLAILVGFVCMLLRAGDTVDILLSAGAGLCLVVAIILICTPTVSMWIRGATQPHSAPLTSFQLPRE